MGGGDNMSSESENSPPSNAMSPAPLAMSAPLRSATTYAPNPAPLDVRSLPQPSNATSAPLDVRSLPPIDFALLGHPSNYEHLGDIFVHSRADFSREKLTKYKATLEKIFEWTPSYASKDPLVIHMADGRKLSGRLIFCTFLPETIHSPRKMLATYQKILDGCRLAKNLGAKVVGLGGFTSIVGGTQGEK